MDDDLDAAGHNVLVATTLATCLLASSAFIWRSNLRNLVSDTLDKNRSKSRVRIASAEDSPIIPDKEPKAARSKERRRRGKDPVKELLKSGKKTKGLEKLVKEPIAVPPAAEPPRMDRSRDPSLSTSSRSVSSASSSRGTAGLLTGDDDEKETPTVISTSTSSHSSNSSTTFTSLDSFSTRNTSPSPSEDAPSVVTSKSLPLLDTDPWAWDGTGSSRKPPRFQRSVSPLPTSVSMPAVSKSFAEQSIPASSTSSSSSSLATESGTPKRVSTPRGSGTPNGTPPPSLSTQTELASLRGALEASKLREEKTKADMDRITKEVEALRWESSVWRRREVELQTHIHHLMHQLQGYAALYASISSPQQQHLQVPNSTHGGTSSTNTSPNGYQVPLPAPPSPLPMLSPTGMLSPMHASPISPFFGYPVHPSTPQHPVPPTQYPMIYPLSTSQSGSSTESLSPDSSGSPLAAPIIFDRGRRRTRTRTQTANGRIGGGSANGWKEDEQRDGAGDDEAGSDSGDEDGGFSEVLADAILKRPESIKSTKRKKTKEREEKPLEFTFPSLSEFGNVKREAVVDDGWLQVEQNVPEEDKEPLILSYHRPSSASRETTEEEHNAQDVQSQNHETETPS